MPASKELGFSGLLLLVVLVSFVIRQKWRTSVARKEEIRKLVVLAAEEAARAELEASVEYNSVVSVCRQRCAVCFSPTTTRCSRCKAVKYCSGKCQIIHWRQGHKEGCHPPNPETDCSSFSRSSSRSGSEAKSENSFSFNKCTDSEEDHHFKASIISSEPRDSFEASFSPVSTSENETIAAKPDERTHETSGPITEIPNFSTSSDHSMHDFMGPVPDIACETTVLNNLVGTSGLSYDESPSNPTVKTHKVDTISNTESPPFEFKLLNNSPSFRLKHKEKAPNSGVSSHGEDGVCENGDISDATEATTECKQSSPDPVEAPQTSDREQCGFSGSENGNSVRFDSVSLQSPHSSSSSEGDSSVFIRSSSSRKAPDRNDGHEQGRPMSNMVPNMSQSTRMSNFTHLRSKSVDSVKVFSLPKESNDEGRVPKFRWQRFTSSGHSSYGDGRGSASSKANYTEVLSTGSSQAASPVSNGISGGLRTSVRKVVQQFRVSKLSKHNPMFLANEVARKPSKMLFPYDMFAKLYNWERVELWPCGLTNCGNSCYANAVLQCLTFTRPLTAYLLQGLHSRTCQKKDWCFTCEFEGLVLSAREGKSSVSPIKILSQIQNIGSNLGYGREEDAHEFLRYAIDKMQSVCLEEAGKNAMGPLMEETTLIQLTFGGYLHSDIKCLRCQAKSERHERMMDLTVEIQGDIGTLEEALTQFTTPEILEGDNKYKCDRCKSYAKARKRLTVYEAPNILTIVLKRFQSGKFGKLNKSVRFPETLDLSPYMTGESDKSPLYKLYAVVVHLDIMNASFSGHYVCYVRSLQGKWYKIDDSKVKPVDLDRVLSKGAYMLLYSRFSPRLPSLIDCSKSKKSSVSPTEPVGTNRRTKIPSPMVPKPNPSRVFAVPEERTHWVHPYYATNTEMIDLFDEELLPRRMVGTPRMDFSSDSSSLFSGCSDETSWSTESTRDSTSTDDLSEYIFGDSSGHHPHWNRHDDSSDASSPSPTTRFHPKSSSNLAPRNGSSPERGTPSLSFSFSNQMTMDGKGNSSPFLYSDPTNASNTNHYRKWIADSSKNEIDQEGLYTQNFDDALLSRERTTQGYNY
ncbi:hypothetical protein AMTRI_Chr04g187370 [Amborella trichopoda]